ncbi:uncharacterized protein LOC115997591 [Ipomoea triloba]|uniref:uncharacterized protein LOC115997591 n=1 Tax=Ipomoea triloba TaxID=35885 RepID=UPI00125D1B9B|nr:uncharacterized protein LOC115997591 [Ipomoea triloba]
MSILKVICAFLFLLIASLGAEARNLLDTYGRTSRVLPPAALTSSPATREVSTSSPAAGKLQDDDNLLLMVTSNCDSDNLKNMGRPPGRRSPPPPKPDDPWEQKIIDDGRKTCSNNKYERPGGRSPPPAPKPEDPPGPMIINAFDGGRKTIMKGRHHLQSYLSLGSGQLSPPLAVVGAKAAKK